MDALGHFAYLEYMRKGEGAIPVDTASYYGGYKQGDVKPNAASPLLKLGIENVPPIITSAVLLDAKSHLGGGEVMQLGQLVTTTDIEAMLAAQGLGWHGLLPGDVVYIYTGWSDHWKDPDVDKVYYTEGPAYPMMPPSISRKKRWSSSPWIIPSSTRCSKASWQASMDPRKARRRDCPLPSITRI
ncbi:MAG: cyclase family protein [Alphaproteobacteria bacterium]